MNLESFKTKLSISAIARNLGSMPEEEQKKLVEGLKAVPTRQIFEQAQYLNNVMLPRIAEKRSMESEDYKFYKSVFDTLMWCILIIDRYEFLSEKYAHLRLLREFYQEQCTKYEKELQKYTTLEDLLFSQSLDKYSQIVGKRAEDILNSKI